MGAGGVFVCQVPMQGPGQSELGDSGWANLCSPAWAPSLVPAPRTQESALEAGPPKREVRMLREGEPSFNASVPLGSQRASPARQSSCGASHGISKEGCTWLRHVGCGRAASIGFPSTLCRRRCTSYSSALHFSFLSFSLAVPILSPLESNVQRPLEGDWPLHFGGFCCPPLPESSSAQVDAAGLAHTLFSRAFTRHCPLSSLSGHVGCALICVFRFTISLASLWELSFLSQIPTTPKSSSWIQN